MNRLLKLYNRSIKHLNEKDESQDKTHDLLKANIIENKSATLWNQGCSPQIARTPSGINEDPIDDPNYLNMHHERMQTIQLTTWNVRAWKDNSKAQHKLELDKKKHTYLISTHSTQLNSGIRYSIER